MKSYVANFEKICEASSPLYCPIEDAKGVLHVVSSNGDIYQIIDNELQLQISAPGQPTSIAYDNDGMLYMADSANHAVMSQSQAEGDTKVEMNPFVKDYENTPLLGPHTLLFSPNNNSLYFTDSGAMGVTNLEYPKGSVFCIDFEYDVLKPLAYHCLAQPSGIAISSDGRIYVAETCANRIIRFIKSSAGVYHANVFIQFSGKYGPTAIAINHNDMIFVARYDFMGPDGLINVLSQNGDLVQEIIVPGCPEITGISFSKSNPDLLYLTEITHNTMMKMITK
jgi:sugar lactone lactonase YvrE